MANEVLRNPPLPSPTAHRSVQSRRKRCSGRLRGGWGPGPWPGRGLAWCFSLTPAYTTPRRSPRDIQGWKRSGPQPSPTQFSRPSGQSLGGMGLRGASPQRASSTAQSWPLTTSSKLMSAAALRPSVGEDMTRQDVTHSAGCQGFTKPLPDRPTLFVEIISRMGSQPFGKRPPSRRSSKHSRSNRNVAGTCKRLDSTEFHDEDTDSVRLAGGVVWNR